MFRDIVGPATTQAERGAIRKEIHTRILATMGDTLKRINLPGVFFVTKRILLSDTGLTRARCDMTTPADIIVKCLIRWGASGELRLAAFCIMPDHWHVLFSLCGNNSSPAGAGSHIHGDVCEA